jgi:hypothetical protein
MKYILLDLVYFGGIIHLLVGKRGGRVWKIRLLPYLQREACKGFMFCIHSFSIEEVACQACE